MTKPQMLFMLFLTLLSRAYGQDGNFDQSKDGSGTVYGKVVDAENAEGLAYANVTLYLDKKNTPYKVKTTKGGGRFIFRNLPFGKYYLEISFSGMDTYKSAVLSLNKQQKAIELGTINLTENRAALAEIQVVGDKTAEQMDLVTKRFNVGQNANNAGGSALDAMRNIPSLNVDIDGQIQLRGSSNVRILVNGRPSALVGSGGELRLDQIPVASIEAIEVITNPSAKYEAAGKAGVINIIMKKPSQLGFNYSTNFMVGSNDKWNTGVNMNYQTNRWNWRGGYQFNRSLRNNYKDLNRQSIFPDTTYFLEEESFVDKLKIGHTFIVGLDWKPSAKTEVFSTFTTNPHTGQKTSVFNYDFFNENYLYDSDNIRTTQDDEQMGGTQIELGLNQRFARKGMRLNSVYSLDIGNKKDSVLSSEDFFFQGDLLENKKEKNKRDQTIQTHLFKSDFTYPITQAAKIETGINYSLRYLNNDFKYFDRIGEEWVPNASRTNDLDYQEKVAAAYLMMTSKIKRWTFNAGLRVENTDILIALAKATDKHPNTYTNLFPSAHIGYNVIPKGKGKVLLSYSRRIKRPSYRKLNPFASYNDNQNIRRGNPLLKPALTDSWELGWQSNWKKGSITPAIFYRKTINGIAYFTHLLPNGIRELTFKNTKHSSATGIEFNGSYYPLKWLRLSGNVSYFQQEIDGQNIDDNLSNKGAMMTSRMMLSLTPTKPLSIQISSFYHTGFVGLVGKGEPMKDIDLGMTYKVLQNRGKLIFRVSDIFNTRQFAFNVDAKDIQMNFTRKRESRIIWLGFNWALKQNKRKGKTGKKKHGGGGMEF